MIISNIIDAALAQVPESWDELGASASGRPADLTPLQVVLVRIMHEHAKMSEPQIAAAFNVNQPVIHRALNRESGSKYRLV